MIREDRIWEYFYGQNVDHLFRMKFDGVTEVNGKTYHNFVMCGLKKIEYNPGYKCSGNDFDNISTEFYNEVEDLEIPTDLDPILLREDNGRLYRLLSNKYTAPYIHYYETSDNPKITVSHIPYSDKTEVLLCDFNLDEGDSFLSKGLYHKEMDTKNRTNLLNMEMLILEKSTIEIQGEECRMFKGLGNQYVNHCDKELKDTYWATGSISDLPCIIEGIGPTDYGMLSMYLAVTIVDHMKMSFFCDFYSLVSTKKS